MDFFNKKSNDELKKVEKEAKQEKKVAEVHVPEKPKVSELDKVRQQVKNVRAGIASKELDLNKIIENRSKNIQYDRDKLATLEAKLWSLGG